MVATPISLRNGVPPPKEGDTAREEASGAPRREGRAASHHRHGRRDERREERREEARKEE